MRNSPFSFVKVPSSVPLIVIDTAGTDSFVKLFLIIPLSVVVCAEAMTEIVDSAISIANRRVDFLIMAFLRLIQGVTTDAPCDN